MAVFSEPLRKKIEGYLTRYETRRSSILPILHAIQDEHGYINEDQIEELHNKYDLHRVHVKEVITFYDVYHNTPQPKYVIRFCKNLTCHMLGARPAIERVQSHIDQYRAEIGDDCPFSLEEFPCLGKCDGAPVMLVNKERVEHVTVDKVDAALAKFAPLPKTGR
jgi:NADH-quinone oxidoreductase subunit E